MLFIAQALSAFNVENHVKPLSFPVVLFNYRFTQTYRRFPARFALDDPIRLSQLGRVMVFKDSACRDNVLNSAHFTFCSGLS